LPFPVRIREKLVAEGKAELHCRHPKTGWVSCHIRVKRRDVNRQLERNGCEFLRGGGNHTVYVNVAMRKAPAVPSRRLRSRNDSILGTGTRSDGDVQSLRLCEQLLIRIKG
jgi:predicted RNA binding protein YcfA (HicA-like mRNA interferase family)